jgi:hypothetical protein
MKKIGDIDGSVFLYDPTKDTEIEKLKNSHSDFQEDLEKLNNYRKKLLKFIVLQYDIQSPLRIEYSDYFKRKANAAMMAGFKRNAKTGKFKEEIADAMIGNNDVVNKMIVRYVMNFYNEDYLQLIIYWEMFGRFGREQFIKGISPQSVNALNNIKETISQLTEKIFGGRETMELKKQLYRALDMEKENLHPDNIAKELSQNPDLFEEGIDG